MSSIQEAGRRHLPQLPRIHVPHFSARSVGEVLVGAALVTGGAAFDHCVISPTTDHTIDRTSFDTGRERQPSLFYEVIPGQEIKAAAGSILTITPEGITIACGQQALLLTTVQPEASKTMPAHAYALGAHLKAGDKINPV